jgi:hypothetical protein
MKHAAGRAVVAAQPQRLALERDGPVALAAHVAQPTAGERDEHAVQRPIRAVEERRALVASVGAEQQPRGGVTARGDDASLPLAGQPSSSTVQTPQTPSSQPSLTSKMPSVSRSSSSSVWLGRTSTSRGRPLRMSRAIIVARARPRA